jgi:hypothetical protein
MRVSLIEIRFLGRCTVQTIGSLLTS